MKKAGKLTIGSCGHIYVCKSKIGSRSCYIRVNKNKLKSMGAPTFVKDPKTGLYIKKSRKTTTTRKRTTKKRRTVRFGSQHMSTASTKFGAVSTPSAHRFGAGPFGTPSHKFGSTFHSAAKFGAVSTPSAHRFGAGPFGTHSASKFGSTFHPSTKFGSVSKPPARFGGPFGTTSSHKFGTGRRPRFGTKPAGFGSGIVARGTNGLGFGNHGWYSDLETIASSYVGGTPGATGFGTPNLVPLRSIESDFPSSVTQASLAPSSAGFGRRKRSASTSSRKRKTKRSTATKKKPVAKRTTKKLITRKRKSATSTKLCRSSVW